MLSLNDSAQYIKNVGPQRYRDFARMGVETVRDLLYLFPRKYLDRTRFNPIGKLPPDETVSVRGRVLSCGLSKLKSGLTIYQALLSDETGNTHCNWFNQAFLQEKITPGSQIIVSGKVQFFGKTGLQINVTDYEILPEDSNGDMLNFGRIVPVYPLTGKLTQKTMRLILRGLIEEKEIFGQVNEPLPESLRHSLHLPEEHNALRNIHFPESLKAGERARKKLAFNEFFLFQLGIVYAGKKLNSVHDGIRHTPNKNLAGKFIKSLPFPLTNAQKKVLREIHADMMDAAPMNRMVQGDVGCGKTVVAVCAATIAVEGGYQASVMAPTETLARQHFKSISAMLEPLGITTALLTKDIKGKTRKTVLEKIKTGHTNIIIGTHSLIQDDVVFDRLGLCIIDEQHKFGVFQRTLLQEKGNMPDFLMMTATPIPRSLAITVFGDMDMSIIDELPKGRIPINTYWIGDEKLEGAYKFIKEQAQAGFQAYIVYPLVEDSQSLTLKSAQTMVKTLEKRYYSDVGIGLVHGKMKSKAKNEVMEQFRNGEIKILVSTTVVEVGIDVAKATVMLIENAERFGLAQLHQLRGRIGRGKHKSWCILHSIPATKHAAERLKAMEETSDGFEIARRDLVLRGPGEFFGTRQHGVADFNVGDPVGDIKIMETAKECAEKMLDSDPQLSLPEHQVLKKNLQQKYGTRFHFMRG